MLCTLKWHRIKPDVILSFLSKAKTISSSPWIDRLRFQSAAMSVVHWTVTTQMVRQRDQQTEGRMKLNLYSAGLSHLSSCKLTTYFPSQSRSHRPVRFKKQWKSATRPSTAFVVLQGLRAIVSSHSGGGMGAAALVKGLAAMRGRTQH